MTQFLVMSVFVGICFLETMNEEITCEIQQKSVRIIGCEIRMSRISCCHTGFTNTHSLCLFYFGTRRSCFPKNKFIAGPVVDLGGPSLVRRGNARQRSAFPCFFSTFSTCGRSKLSSPPPLFLLVVIVCFAFFLIFLIFCRLASAASRKG